LVLEKFLVLFEEPLFGEKKCFDFVGLKNLIKKLNIICFYYGFSNQT